MSITPTVEKTDVLFPMGRVVVTGGAIEAVSLGDIATGLLRHARGNWGKVSADDRAANDRALVSGGRLLSVYRDHNGIQFWILTETDRSATTVLLPEDY